MTDFSYRDFSNINNDGKGTDFTKPPYTYDNSYQSATGKLTMIERNIDKYYAAYGWFASSNGLITISGGNLSENDKITIVDAYGTSKSYLGKTTGVSGDIDLTTGNTIFIVGSSIQDSRDAILLAINHKNGHNGTIKAVSSSTDKIELTQIGGGSRGSITENTDSSSRIAIVDFQNNMNTLLSSAQKTFFAGALDDNDNIFDFEDNNGNAGSTLIDGDGFTATNATFDMSSDRAVLINNSTAQGIVTLPLTTVAGITYQVKFDLIDNTNSNVNVSLGSSAAYNSSNKVTTTSTATGITLDNEYTADDTTTFLAIQLTSSTNTHSATIDNLEVYQVAKPASFQLVDYGEAKSVTFTFSNNVTISGQKDTITTYSVGFKDLPYNAGLTVIGDSVANAINLANQNGDLRIKANNENGVITLTQDIKGSSGLTTITLGNDGGAFSKADFSMSADLEISQFINANFTGANLTNCNFSNINITGANFTGANLTGANFIGTTLFKNVYSFKGDGNTTKFYFPDRDKIPNGPTEYFKGKDENNLKWTVTITTSTGTVDMSEKFIINNKVYPNIITFYTDANNSAPGINSLIIAKFTCNNTIFNNTNLTNLRSGKNLIVNPELNKKNVILPEKYQLYQYSDTNICKIINNKINIDGKDIQQYPLMLRKGQSYIFDVSHESNTGYKLYISDENNDNLRIGDWQINSVDIVTNGSDLSQADWNSNGWTQANPSVYDDSTNEAYLINTLSSDLIANSNYKLTFTVATASLNLTIGAGDIQFLNDIFFNKNDYSIGIHTINLKTTNTNRTHLWFLAFTTSAGSGSITDVSLKRNYISGSSTLNVSGTGTIGTFFPNNTEIYNSKGDSIGIVTSTSSNTLNFLNYTNIDLVDDEYFYKKLPERNYTPGNQHSFYSKAEITILNGVINTIQDHLHTKYFKLKDFKGNEVVYIFENSTVTSGTISNGKVQIRCNVGIDNDSSLIAAEIVTALNHSNGHGNYNTMSVTRDSNVISIKQLISGEIGNNTITLFQDPATSTSILAFTSTIGINNHGFIAGTELKFTNITNVTRINENESYYVSESNNDTNTFKISTNRYGGDTEEVHIQGESDGTANIQIVSGSTTYLNITGFSGGKTEDKEVHTNLHYHHHEHFNTIDTLFDINRDNNFKLDNSNKIFVMSTLNATVKYTIPNLVDNNVMYCYCLNDDETIPSLELTGGIVDTENTFSEYTIMGPKVDLSEIQIYNRTLKEFDLTEANLTNSIFQNITFEFVDFTNSIFTGAELINCRFDNTIFSETNLTKSKITGSNLDNNILTQSTFTNTDFGHQVERIVDYDHLYKGNLLAGDNAATDVIGYTGTQNNPTITSLPHKKIYSLNGCVFNNEYFEKIDEILTIRYNGLETKKIYSNYRVRDTNINGEIKYYIKDNGGEFSVKNPGRKITTSTWSGTPKINEDTFGDEDNTLLNTIYTDGWTKAPFINDSLFIGNIIIKNNIYTIKKIYNTITNEFLSGGEVVRTDMILTLTLDKRIGVDLVDNLNIYKLEFSNYITLKFNEENGESTTNSLSFWNDYNVNENQKVTTMMSTHNLEKGKIEFVESQMIVVAWYEENEISRNIDLIQGNDNLLFIPGNKFNNFDIVEYQHFDFADITITGITQANPAVVTAVNHNLATNDNIKIRNVGGMTEVNNNIYTVQKVDDDTFNLLDLEANQVDSSGFTAYTSGGLLYHTIHSITKANPGVITLNNHGFLDGDVIYITDCIGMTELNNRSYYVTSKTTNTFSIIPAYDLNNTNESYLSYSNSDRINTTDYNTYLSSGKVNLLFSNIGSGGTFYTNLPEKPFLKSVNNNCLYFNGVNQYLQIPYNATLVDITNTDYTFETFVYIENVTFVNNHNYIVSYRKNNLTDWGIRINNSYRLLFYYWTGHVSAYRTITSTYIQKYTWYHISFTYKQTTNELKIYINGNLVDTHNPASISASADGILNIGRGGDDANVSYLKGYISNLRIVTGTIDGTSLIYTDSFTPSTSNLSVVTNTQLLFAQEPFLLTDLSDTPHSITNYNGVCVALKDPFKLPNSIYFKGMDDAIIWKTYDSKLYWFNTENDFTLECFVYFDDTPASFTYNDGTHEGEIPVLVGNKLSKDVNNDWSFGPNKNLGLSFYYYNQDDIPNFCFSENNLLNLKTWHHIAFTFDADMSEIKLWLDGNLVKSKTLDLSGGNAPANTSLSFDIGGYNFNYFKGYVSNLRIVRGGHDTLVYTSNFTVPSSNLTAITDTQLLSFVNSVPDISSNQFVLTPSLNHYTDYCCSYASPFITGHENNPSVFKLGDRFNNSEEGIVMNQDQTSSIINLQYSNGSKSLGTIKSTHTIKMQLYQSYLWIEGVVGGVGSWYNQNKDKIYKIKDFEDINVVNLCGKLNLESLSSDAFILGWCQYNNYNNRFPESNNKQYSYNARIYNNFKVDQYFDDSSGQSKSNTYSNFNKDFFQKINANNVLSYKPVTHRIDKELKIKITNLKEDNKFCISWLSTVNDSVLVKPPAFDYLLEDTLETNIMDINFVENNSYCFGYDKSFGITFLRPPVTTLISNLTSTSTTLTTNRIQLSTGGSSVLSLIDNTVALSSGSINDGEYIIHQTSTSGDGTGFVAIVTFVSNESKIILIENNGQNYKVGDTITFTDIDDGLGSLNEFTVTVATVGDKSLYNSVTFNTNGGYILIDNEEISYTNITRTGENFIFHGLIRGVNSTIATEHYIGDQVTCKKITLDSKLSDIPHQNDLIRITYYNRKIYTVSNLDDLDILGVITLNEDIQSGQKLLYQVSNGGTEIQGLTNGEIYYTLRTEANKILLTDKAFNINILYGNGSNFPGTHTFILLDSFISHSWNKIGGNENNIIYFKTNTETSDNNSSLLQLQTLNLTWRDLINNNPELLIPQVSVRNEAESAYLYYETRKTFKLFNNSNISGSIYQIYLNNYSHNLSIENAKYRKINLSNNYTVKILDSKQSGIYDYYDICKKSNFKSLLLAWKKIPKHPIPFTNPYNLVYRREVNYTFNNINNIENIIFGNLKNLIWNYVIEKTDHYENLQIASLDNDEEVYLWEFNNYTYLNLTKNLINIKFEENNYCKKSKLINNNKGGFVIVNSEDNKESQNIIKTKTVGFQNYNNLGYKTGPYISLKTSEYTFKSLETITNTGVENDFLFSNTTSLEVQSNKLTSSNFLPSGVLQINSTSLDGHKQSELIKYTGLDIGNNLFTGITRGFNNTVALTHPVGMAEIKQVSSGIENLEITLLDNGTIPIVWENKSYPTYNDTDIFLAGVGNYFNTSMRKSDLRAITFEDTDLSFLIFDNSDIRNSNLKHTILNDTSFYNCSLDNIMLNFVKQTNLSREINFNNSKLISADLSGNSLNLSDFTYCNFINADLTNSNLQYLKLENANFMNADLFSADISYSEISNTKFQDVQYLNQRENIFLLKPAKLTGLKVKEIEFNDESIYTKKLGSSSEAIGNIKNYAYIKHLINKNYTIYITSYTYGVSLQFNTSAEYPSVAGTTLNDSRNYWTLEDTGDNNGTFYLKYSNDIRYLTDSIKFTPCTDSMYPWPYKTDFNRLTLEQQTEENKYQQKWKFIDSGSVDNNNSVYITSWRNWVIGFAGGGFLELFPNDEFVVGKPEIISDDVTNFLIWHGIAEGDNLSKDILLRETTPPEGNTTAIFYSDFLNIPSKYQILKRKSDGKKFFIGPGLDLESSDLSGINFSNTICWFNKYGRDMKKYSNNFQLTNYLQNELDLFYNKLNLMGSNLSNVNFTNTDLGELNLIGCNLNKCTLNGTILLYAKLYDEDFTDQKKTNKSYKDIFVNNSLFSGGIRWIWNENWDDSYIIGNNLINPGLSNWEQNYLPDNWSIRNGYLIGKGVNLTEAGKYSVKDSYKNLFKTADFNGIDLSYSIIAGVDMSLATLTNVKSGNLVYNNKITHIYNNSGYSTQFGNDLINLAPKLPNDYKLIKGYIIGPNVNLMNAILKGINLTDMDLSNVNFSNACIEGCIITNVNFSGANFYNIESGKLTFNENLPPYNLPSGWKIKNGYLIGENDNSNYSYLIDSRVMNLSLPSNEYRVPAGAMGSNPGDLEDKTSLSWTDDDNFSVTISNGNKFPFYGTEYTTLYLHSNGAITFDSNILTWKLLQLPEIINNKKAIFPFFEDFYFYSGSEDFYHGYTDDNFDGTGNSKSVFVVTWHGVKVFGSSIENYFEVRLFLSNSSTPGKIVFRYGGLVLNVGSNFSTVRFFGITNANNENQPIVNLTNKSSSTDNTLYTTAIQYFTNSSKELQDFLDKEITFTPYTLKSSNLTRADLTGVDFTDQLNLQYVDFTNSILIGANFTGCNLSNSIFTGADLSEAILTNANLTNANFTNAKLIYANLVGTTQTNTTFTGANQNNSITDSNQNDISSELNEIETLQTKINTYRYNSASEKSKDEKLLQQLKEKLQYSSNRYNVDYKLPQGTYSYNFENQVRR